jgi:AcrR family transcriptional regulator
MPAGDTRQALLGAAIAEARTGGDVSLQRLVRRAGLTTGAVYSQFSGRGELLVEAAFSPGGSAVIDALRRRSSTRALLRAVRAEAGIDPLVVALVDARGDDLALDVARARLVALCDDDAQQARLVVGVACELLRRVDAHLPSERAVAPLIQRG